MEVIPAIDIRGGKCVRLYQGDYGRETVYSESPLKVASHWVETGATRLHVVDLDGARAGAPVNIELVGAIASSVEAPVQCGGGIRTLETARAMLSLGVSRVVIGSAAVEAGPEFVESACRELGPDAVVVGVDARDGHAAIRGWVHSTDLTVADLVSRVEAAGVRRIVYTDISRDGTLTEPNFDAIEAVMGMTSLKVLAAGGISSVDHLSRLARLGVEGAIVGKAVYTGDIDLRQAIDAVSSIV